MFLHTLSRFGVVCIVVSFFWWGSLRDDMNDDTTAWVELQLAIAVFQKSVSLYSINLCSYSAVQNMIILLGWSPFYLAAQNILLSTCVLLFCSEGMRMRLEIRTQVNIFFWFWTWMGRWCGDSASKHHWEELWHLLPNPNTLVAISRGMQPLKLCSNKILKFLTGSAG